MKRLTGKELVDYITKNGLEDALVSVTATIYRKGDHDCVTTTDVSVSSGMEYIYGEKEPVQTVNIYVDDALY